MKRVLDFLLKILSGFGKDDLLALIGAAFIFRGFWYWDEAYSFLSVGALALAVGLYGALFSRGR